MFVSIAKINIDVVGYDMEIHNRLRDRKFRFVLVRKQSKEPFETGWSSIKNYQYDDEKIKKHSGNIGILTGNGIIVFDCDNNKAEELARKLPQTFVVGTSHNNGYRKKHFYFYSDLQRKIILEKNKEHLGDIQTNGQQALLPGCIHPNGTKYEVIEDRPISTVLSEDLIKLVKPLMKSEVGSIDVKTLIEGTSVGNRNDSCFQLANYHFRTGKDEQECLGLIEEWNKKNDVPLNQDEIKRTVRTLYSRTAPYKIMYNCNPDFFFNVTDKGRKFFVPRRLAESIVKEVSFATLRGSNKVYYYDDGIFKEGGEDKIKVMCMQKLGDVFKINFYNETLAFIQGLTLVDPNSINSGWINMNNGLYDVNTGLFIKHTNEIFTISRVPIDYDEKADCPFFKDKLKEKIDFDTEQTVQEMFGYCFLPGQRYEVAFLLYGRPRTMKSTVLYALSSILGDDCLTSFELQDLCDNQFTIAYLFGKLANICADLSSRSLRDTGKFMELVGGDKMTVCRKYEHPITFYPPTKLIFSANVIPATGNKNLAFYRRWILLKFDKQTKPEEVDPHMRDKIDEELPGIFNWAMSGLKRLLSFDRFTSKLTPEEVKDLYERNSDTISSFIINRINSDDDDGVITKRRVYNEYLKYCKDNHLNPENVIKFGRWFKETTGCGTAKFDGIPAYTGVRFNEEKMTQKRLA